jgi:hypothetical protein
MLRNENCLSIVHSRALILTASQSYKSRNRGASFRPPTNGFLLATIPSLPPDMIYRVLEFNQDDFQNHHILLSRGSQLA